MFSRRFWRIVRLRAKSTKTSWRHAPRQLASDRTPFVLVRLGNARKRRRDRHDLRRAFRWPTRRLFRQRLTHIGIGSGGAGRGRIGFFIRHGAHDECPFCEKIATGERDQYTAKPLPLNHATRANDKSLDSETPEPQIVSPRRAVLRLTFPREHRPPP